MKKFYTCLLISCVIFASFSINPGVATADDGVGPTIIGAGYDRLDLTRGQKVEVVLLAEDPDGLANTAKMELVMPDGSIKILNPTFSGDRYRIFLDLSRYWEFPDFGTYQIKNVTVMDRYGNVSVKDLTNNVIQFILFDDKEAPTVKEVKLSRDTLYTSWYDYLEIEVPVEDEGKPADQATVYFEHVKSGEERSVQLQYNEHDKVYRAHMSDWYDAIFGEWKVQRIEVSDVAGNTVKLNGPFEGDNVFNLLNLEDDYQKPEHISSEFVTLNPYNTMADTYQIVAKDNAFVKKISATFKHRNTGKVVTLSQDDAEFPNVGVGSGEETTANLSFDVVGTFHNLSGFWDVTEIEVTDQNQNKTTITDMNDSLYVERYIADLGVHVIQENTVWEGRYINQDVFVMPGALLSTVPNVTITKNLYVLGALRTYGGLSVYGTLYGNRMTFGHNSTIYNGDIQVVGSNSLWSMHMSNVTHFDLPISTGGALVDNGDNTFDLVGLTLPLATKININGVETDLSSNGRFKAVNIPMNEQATAIVQITATNGVNYSTSLKVYDKQKPVVKASKDSGIYLSGTNLDLTSTKEGAIYYDLNYGTEYSGLYTNFYPDFIINNDVSIKYYSVDPAGIESEVEERKYRVFSVYNPKASESFIQGSGSPGLKIQVEVDEKSYSTTINSEGRFLIEGLDLTESKNVQVFATDEEYTSESYTFEVIDDLPIIIKGAEDQKVYNRDVTISYNKGGLYLNGIHYIGSGTTFTEDGYYELHGHDGYGLHASISFTIDKTAPQVSDVQTGKAYKQAVYPTFTEGTATLNGVKYTSGTKIDQEGEYVLVVTDQAGNNTTLYFTIDYKAPIVSGVENGKIYNQHVTPTFAEGSAKLNGNVFASGTVIKTEGLHELIVQDLAGNTTTHKFEIDVTPPKVTNVSDEATYRRAVIYFTDGVAKLNGTQIQTNHEVTKDGKYDLVVTDRAGNVTKLSFEVDSIAPIVSGVESGKRYNRTVTPTFTEGVGKLNGKLFTSGTAVQAEGSYELSVEDKAGNTTVTPFIIDLTAPVVTGVQTNTQYTKPVVISFNEGSATLNGKTIAKNYTVDKDGAYELKVKDSAGNETIVMFGLDQLPPVVTGVEAKAYRQHVTPVFVEGTGTLNGKPYVSGTPITTDGEYELEVSDRAGNKTVIRFKVDQKPVTVTGVESGKTYQRVTPLFSEGTAVLNGVPFRSGTVINQSGAYVLLVTDEAGNETTIRFTIDSTPPALTGFTTGKSYYRSVALRFGEGTATLNGAPYKSGKLVNQPGKYTLRLTDEFGNETVRAFTIDRTAPVISGVKSRQVTNQSVTIQYNEGTATLNGKRIRNSWTVKNSGAYTLRVTDQAGNITALTFTIDKVAPSKPSISTLTNKSTKVTGKAEKGSTVSITYNGRTYTTKASTAGTYSYNLKTTKAGATVTVRAKDAAGNQSTTSSSKVLNTFATFTVNTLKSSATSVTGKGNKTATVQAFVGTKAISKTAKVDSKGYYKLTIPRQKAGVTVTVKMKQTGYLELKKVTKVVK
jgi:hypothetical protein